MSLSLPRESLGPSLAHQASLVDALETERRLLDELARVLVVQRDGITSDDLQTLDESVFAAHRVLRTLQEARQRRRTLLQILGGSGEAGLGELESVLGAHMPEDVRASRDALLLSAESLARELAMSKQVIGGAMEMGERLLEAFIGGPETKQNVYVQGAAPKKPATSGAIVNTRV